jgi:hypothetical protein
MSLIREMLPPLWPKLSEGFLKDLAWTDAIGWIRAPDYRVGNAFWE